MQALPASFEDRRNGKVVNLEVNSTQVSIDLQRRFWEAVLIVRGYQEVVLGCRAQMGLEGSERNNLVGIIKVGLDHVGMDLLGLLNTGGVVMRSSETGVWFVRKIWLVWELG